MVNKIDFKSKNNKKAFTLIELIAVIVIFGILMLIAIPAVSRYIDNSKKEAYIKTVNNLVDTVRYGINSGDSNYISKNNEEKIFFLTDIDKEKGTNQSPYGDFIKSYSYVKVTNSANGYKYEVQAKDKGGFCIVLEDINDITIDDIIKNENCNSLNPYYKSYKIGDIISFPNANTKWYVIEDSPSSQDYIVLLKKADSDFDVSYSAYYSSSNCVNYDMSGCSSSYSSSNVKTILQEYLQTFGEDNLKEVSNYKIRLITTNDLINLGWTDLNKTATTSPNSVPRWVYSVGYWTMTPSSSNRVVSVYSSGNNLRGNEQYVYLSNGVRPVINLLKSSIEN